METDFRVSIHACVYLSVFVSSIVEKIDIRRTPMLSDIVLIHLIGSFYSLLVGSDHNNACNDFLRLQLTDIV